MKKIFIIAFLSFSSYAQINFLKEYRPFVEENISKDVANMIWGKIEEMELPTIPIVSKDAKDISVYNKKKYKSPFTKEEMSSYNASYIKEVILVTRDAEANRDELGKWYNTLEQGGTRDGMYRSIVLSQYYQRLENYNQEISESVSNFTIEFFKIYLNKDVTKEKLAPLNIYSIKRIVTENALEVSDAILVNSREDFARWYAVFSRTLAKDYPIWKNKLRASTNDKVHYKWAMKMTPELVKSEIIIKMHTLYNTLQKRN